MGAIHKFKVGDKLWPNPRNGTGPWEVIEVLRDRYKLVQRKMPYLVDSPVVATSHGDDYTHEFCEDPFKKITELSEE